MNNKYSKIVAFVLIFSIIFTTISFENISYAAAPEISGIKLESIDGESLRYKIWGLYLEDDVKFIIGTREIDSSMYTKSQGEYIIERNASNSSWEIWELPYSAVSKTMEVKAISPDETESAVIEFTMEKVPYINSISTTKVYIDESLTIEGTGFTGVDVVYVAGAPYVIGDDGDPDTGEFTINSDGQIVINSIVAPNQSAAQTNDVKVIKTTADVPQREIIGIYENSIKVVTKVDDIDVEKIVPNTGPIEGGTEVKIYDTDKVTSKIKPDMKIYIVEQGTNNIETENIFTGIEVITDTVGNTVGILGVTPSSPTGSQGVFDIVITDSTGNNEQVLSGAFTYEEKKNLLSISKIEPNSAKATETVDISGANIVNLNIDGLEDVDLIGYADSATDDVTAEDANKAPKYENGKYILNYEGNLNGTPVTIKREITLIIGKTSKITGISLKTAALDTIQAQVAETNDYGVVTVTLNTSTKITDANTSLVIDVREEEAELVDGFTIISSITIPQIDTIEPSKGDINKKIYITIKGDGFQVLADEDQNPIYPSVKVGNKTTEIIGVYDDDGNEVNGIGREIGTVIKAIIPAATGTGTQPGTVAVKVVNPDNGEAIEYDLFEFEKPSRDEGSMPKITELDPNVGPLEGGNTIIINGENFEYLQPIPDVIVTIDGQEAEIVNASSSQIEVIVPPGMNIGEKPVQVITEDGAMDTIDPEDASEDREGYTYVRVLADPQIEAISPDYGGEGTIVYILGKDQGADNPNFFAPVTDDPTARIEEMIGTRVLFNDIDINDIGVEDDSDGSIYEREDPNEDGNLGKLKDEGGDGNIFDGTSRVEVIDENTLRVTIPSGYTAGLKDVTILNPDSSSVIIEDGFDYKIPPINADVQITEISPDIGSNTGEDYITIKGNDFKDGIEVFFGGYQATYVEVVDENELLVKTPAYPLPNPDLESEKSVDVLVINYDGSSAVALDGYTYMAPKTQPLITAIEPNYGNTLGNELVVISGQDFREVDKEDGTVEYPSVYIGGKKAEIVQYKHNELTILTPYYGKEGLVDVTVKNPQAEFGLITKTDFFEYKTSAPQITSVFPEKGQKTGGEEITVKGTEIIAGDFGEIQVLPEDSEFEPLIDVLAIFGEDMDETGISLGKAQNILNDIKVDYDANREEEPATIDDAGTTTTDSLIISYDSEIIGHYDLQPEERRIFVIDWQALGKEVAEEAISVEITDSTLITKRRISPQAEVLNMEDDNEEKIVSIHTPPALFIGEKTLYIENRDGGQDSTSFEYINPTTKPSIIEISPRTEVQDDLGKVTEYLVEGTLEGGMYITIEGYDFDEGVEVYIDDVLAPPISMVVLNEMNEDGDYKVRLVVESPQGTTDDMNTKKKILIINPDGGFVDTSLLETPYYFVFRIPESSPYIESITPELTSQAGNNTVRIVGYDFRTGAKVAVGGRECDVVSVTNDEIVFTTATDLVPGLRDVQVINTDYGVGTKQSALRVVSYPIIKSVTMENGDDINRLSIEGGEKILLLGSDFQSGLTIYFGGERNEISASTDADAKGLFKDDTYYEIVDGTEATEIEFISENKLLVTVPEVLKEGDYTITILNTDGGLSDSNQSVEFRVPIPSDPIGLEAEIVNDKYIRIYGYTSENAVYYEIYTYLGDNYPDDEDFEYLDTTDRGSYKITKFKEIDEDENIYLRIRAVNKYGPSEWSNIVKISYNKLDDIDGIGEQDEDGDLVSNYQEAISKDGVNVVLGNEDLKGSSSKIYLIDLRDKKYQNMTTKIINIPGNLIKKSTRTILVDNGDTRIQFNPSNFYVYSFYNMSSSERDEVYGRLTLKRAEGQDSAYLEKRIPRKYKLKSKIYEVKTELQLEKDIISFNSIQGYMDLEISYDEDQLMGMDESKLQLCRFDQSQGEWIEVAGGIDKTDNKVYGRIYGNGYYGILGEK